MLDGRDLIFIEINIVLIMETLDFETVCKEVRKTSLDFYTAAMQDEILIIY